MCLRLKRRFIFVLWPRPLLVDWMGDRSRSLPVKWSRPLLEKQILPVKWPRPLLADWTGDGSRSLPEFVWEKVWCHSSTMWCRCGGEQRHSTKIKSGISSLVSTHYFSRLTNVTTWQRFSFIHDFYCVTTEEENRMFQLHFLCDFLLIRRLILSWVKTVKPSATSSVSLFSDWLRTPWLMLRLLMDAAVWRRHVTHSQLNLAMQLCNTPDSGGRVRVDVPQQLQGKANGWTGRDSARWAG